jgi:hypothetical protein
MLLAILAVADTTPAAFAAAREEAGRFETATREQ